MSDRKALTRSKLYKINVPMEVHQRLNEEFKESDLREELGPRDRFERNGYFEEWVLRKIIMTEEER